MIFSILFLFIKNKTKMETKENCIICFEDIKSSEMIRKWECMHMFHKDCIDCWDNKCPICRNDDLIVPEITFQISRNPSCPLWLQNISRYCPLLCPNESVNYINKWKDSDCIQNNHEIIFINYETEFKKNVYAICQDCNTYQVVNNFGGIPFSFYNTNRIILRNHMIP